jgi:hypothetical protein
MTKSTQKKKKERKELVSVIEDETIFDYQRCRIGAALPWDHARHAVHAPWAKLSQDIGPRDTGRGIRSGI